MSDRTTVNTLAGAQCSAKRPPFTAESRLRMVFISTMSAPDAKRRRVISCSSSGGISGASKRAEPPPDRRNKTVSFSVRFSVSASASAVAEKVSSSGTGCPASRTSSVPAGPPDWPCLVMMIPPVSRSPKQSQAALPMDQPALPAETRISLPVPKSLPSRAWRTARSGITARIARAMISSASFRKLCIASLPQFRRPAAFMAVIKP